MQLETLDKIYLQKKQRIFLQTCQKRAYNRQQPSIQHRYSIMIPTYDFFSDSHFFLILMITNMDQIIYYCLSLVFSGTLENALCLQQMIWANHKYKSIYIYAFYDQKNKIIVYSCGLYFKAVVVFYLNFFMSLCSSK